MYTKSNLSKLEKVHGLAARSDESILGIRQGSGRGGGEIL